LEETDDMKNTSWRTWKEVEKREQEEVDIVAQQTGGVDVRNKLVGARTEVVDGAASNGKTYELTLYLADKRKCGSSQNEHVYHVTKLH
jgi:hypothetical protein